MTTRFVGIKEFRQNMAEISDSARKKRQRIIIMRKNKPLFELTPLVGDDEGVYTQEFVRGIEEAERQIKKGQTYTAAEVRKMVGL